MLKDGGHLIEAGPLVEEAGAVFVARYDSLAETTAAFDGDPFWTAGLVEQRSIAEWRVGWGVLKEPFGGA